MTTISTSRTIATDRIVAAAMTLVAELGLSGLTMRDLAQAVGKSTTVIVNRFGSKSGLIEAIATAAFEQDEVYHDAFFASVSELALSRDALLVLVGRYLRERALASANFVRVWEELLVSSEPAPFLPPLLVRWEAMRRKAWTAFLARTPGLATFGEAVSTYLIIEQFYAGALGGRADYEVIAAEGLGGLVDRAFGRRDDPASASESYVGRLAIPKAPADGLEVGSLKLELLDVAADQISPEASRSSPTARSARRSGPRLRPSPITGSICGASSSTPYGTPCSARCRAISTIAIRLATVRPTCSGGAI